MVAQICADTRSEAAGRYISFKVLRQSSPCKSERSEGQSLCLQTPTSNPSRGIPTRPAGFSFDITNINSAIPIKLIGPDPSQSKTAGEFIPRRSQSVRQVPDDQD
ncbi:hypothetical protein FHI25_18460 [Thalassospira sp. ER-Se-21-Dark]|nr:hypothetical protein [Thalassospira sp. ER-Se-21-Dark]